MKIPSAYSRLWKNISYRRRKQLILLCAIMVLTTFAEVASIGSVLPFLGVLMAPEQVFAHPAIQPFLYPLGIVQPSQLLFPLTILFILAALFSACMRLILLTAQTRLGFAIGADFSMAVYKNTLYQPYIVHVARNTSQVINAISVKTNTVIHGTLLPLLFIASSCLILLAILIALISIDPIIALTILGGFGGLYGLIIFATKKRLAYDSRCISRESNHVIKALQEGLGGIRDVLIDGSQVAYCKIFRQADLPLRKSQANVQIIGQAPRYFIELIGMTLIALVAYGLVRRDATAATAIPLLGALALGAQRLLPVLQLFYASWTSIRGGQSSLYDLLDLLDQPLPEYADQPVPVAIPFKKFISLDQVSFQYAVDSPQVLKRINFIIPKGSRIGIMGTTGSGKSTLLDIIMGLLQTTEGNLVVDGVTITAQNHRAWQTHISHVPQVIFLADASIAENIAFGIPAEQIDMGRVREAANQAQIGYTIESWPKRYDTFVGERGIRLSGGQRQRIGIARALYKRADFIVFDEATSALDEDTERAVMRAIDGIGKDVTILIVAHRLSTLKSCSQILELEQGEVKRVCNYAEITAGA
jgi:ABC-type bacteriocin/lantibiotic exporter with double-glycine peptidase domain